MSRFLPPDYGKGDETTIGGYAAVHGRPAALEGPDGLAYSVEILTDASDDQARGRFAAYFLFLRWARIGEERVEGHIETGFLEFAESPDGAHRALGAWSIERVRDVLVSELAAREAE